MKKFHHLYKMLRKRRIATLIVFLMSITTLVNAQTGGGGDDGSQAGEVGEVVSLGERRSDNGPDQGGDGGGFGDT